jgi:hypothetical protein
LSVFDGAKIRRFYLRATFFSKIFEKF